MAPLPEVAWAAGLFEGEGSFSASGSRGQVIYAELSMTDEDVVRRFHQVVGLGAVTSRKRGKHWPDHYKSQWRWSCGTREDVLLMVTAFWPWLGQRRQERFLELWYQTSLERRPEYAGSPRRETCARGHNDWYVRPSGRRDCRVCIRAAQRRWKLRQKGVMPDGAIAGTLT